MRLLKCVLEALNVNVVKPSDSQSFGLLISEVLCATKFEQF